MGKSKKSWEKRLAGQPEPLMVDFVQSLSYDKRLYKYDIVASIAHAQMLADQKLISKAELKKIKDGLMEISEEIEEGKFKFDKVCEDIHMAIEAALVTKIGEAGEKLHTGRSRNDQVATDIRLWMRDEIEVLQGKINGLQKALVKLAGKYIKDVMPAYTHLQRAQPVVIAMYLLSFVEQFRRDFFRLKNCRKMLKISPLGSGAIAGSTLLLDRESTAEQLGFSDISYNSIDAVSDRDFCAEFIFDCALIATHLSRLAEDWIIYSSNEFAFVRIDDSYCTSSSMMPQKRNPDVLELIRAKTGSVYGSLMAMLTILKAQPSGYNRDLQEDKIHIFSSADTVEASLDMATAVVLHTKFDKKKISAGLEEGFLDATALAEYLVGKGVAFRQAHGIVGSLVASCEKANKKLADLSLDEFKKFSPLIEDDVYESIGAANVVAKYATEGAAGPEQAKEQIAYWKKQLAK
ncbi:MAG: argininosuccinate lyase [Phycisphaerae bacterium]|nr:argininosuccinate lyase [Phycisphaerae bacterium]NIP52067.1 argininosuccinate lyase [Phycisphaerae bacterium]NIS50032.1 argininosuccinate lyase [Phycisphaerae bacterium]NIU10287.1 argininosuccinate lyase [Phycisphaerae bacterium]NIU55298.1 argininosuccinate lyase [Phycisphaerae bacterium]